MIKNTQQLATETPARQGGWQVAWRVAVLAVLWVLLNGWDPASWLVGAPVVLLGAWIGARLASRHCWCLSLPGLARFFLFFAVESVRGGFDVARRALRPRMGLRPGIICYRMRLPAGAARWLYCNTISLLPGTAVVEFDDRQICVHSLELSQAVLDELIELEERVAGLFGCVLASFEEEAAAS